MIMAAGTGGHVFPALSIADAFKSRSVKVEWLGTPNGMENELLKDTDIPLHRVSVKGLRGAGIVRLLLAPIMLARAFYESYFVLRQVNPDFVIGMGGFVCGPAGIACKLLRKPLFIHEQNAVAGLTNKLLARFSKIVFEAFPNTFAGGNVLSIGNPLRAPIKSLATKELNANQDSNAMHLLVLGGSQGAHVINNVIPEVLCKLGERIEVFSWHQSGQRGFESTLESYQLLDLEVGSRYRVTPFIKNMAEAFSWADVVVCRSGASTVCEVAAAGLPAVFIPYPYHKDQQQTFNASWLASQDAAIIMQQSELNANSLVSVLDRLQNDPGQLQAMSEKARSLAVLDADDRIVSACLEAVNG